MSAWVCLSASTCLRHPAGILSFGFVRLITLSVISVPPHIAVLQGGARHSQRFFFTAGNSTPDRSTPLSRPHRKTVSLRPPMPAAIFAPLKPSDRFCEARSRRRVGLISSVFQAWLAHDAPL